MVELATQGGSGQTEGTDALSNGYYWKYGPKAARKELNTPITHSYNFLDQEQKDFLRRLIRRSQRIPTSTPQSHTSYEGSWYYQGPEPTCVSFALANAYHVLGEQVQPLSMAKLLNAAVTWEGLRPDQALHFISLHPTPIQVFTAGSNEKLIATAQTTDRKSHAQLINENARRVKQIIDSQGVLLTTVDVDRYTDFQETGIHEVCLAGYSVNKKAHMNVQVVDSARGKLWMPIEHVSFALVVNRDDLICKKINRDKRLVR